MYLLSFFQAQAAVIIGLTEKKFVSRFTLHKNCMNKTFITRICQCTWHFWQAG